MSFHLGLNSRHVVLTACNRLSLASLLAFDWLEILPVGSAVRITLVICVLADFYRYNWVNLPKGKPLRLSRERIVRVSIGEMQIIVEKTALD